MKKLQLIGMFLLVYTVGFASPIKAVEQQTPESQLQEILSSMQSLSGHFEQQVYEADELIQTFTGKFILQKPAQFFWQVAAPDELIIAADGVTIQYYDPFIEQITLLEQASAMNSNPFFVLLETENWSQFSVKKQADYWQVTQGTQLVDEAVPAGANAHANQQNLEQVELRLFFTNEAQLSKIEVVGAFGEKSVFHLKDLSYNQSYNQEQFKLVVPEGTEIDDQRNH